MMGLLLLLALAGQGGEDSLQQPQIETIAYRADSLIYAADSGDLILLGAAEVDYREMSLAADTVLFSTSTNVVTASGAPELFDRGESVRGESMVYNLDTRRGRIRNPDSQYDMGYYTGESVTRIGRNEYNIVNARFTTCDQDSAVHYHFYSPTMKVYPKDKAVCRPIYMYIDETPVFYWPWMVFPIRRGRQSGFTLPTFGVTNRHGRYLRGLGYYFGFSDYQDLLLEGDILEKSRVSVSLRERHVIRYLMDGELYTEWRREFREKRDRWMINADHLHDFPDGTTVRLQAEFTSDRSYLEDTQPDAEDRLEREMRSWLSVTRSFGRASFQVVVDRTAFLDTDPDSIENELESETELPDVRVSLPSAPLFDVPASPRERRVYHSVYWSLSGHYLARDIEREETRDVNSAGRANLKLSATERLGGWLSLSPSLTGIITAYDRDRQGRNLPSWAHASAGLRISTDIYGIFTTRLLGLSALRHTVSPSVTYSWSPDRYLRLGRGLEDSDLADSLYYSFSDFRLPGSASRIGLTLSNRLEGKRIRRNEVEKIDLALLDVSTSVDLEAEERRFSNIVTGLEVYPTSGSSFRAEGSYDPYDGRLADLSLYSSVRLSGVDPTFTFRDSTGSPFLVDDLPWMISLRHNYRLGLDGRDDINKLRLTSSISLTPSWEISYSTYYDITETDFISQSYTLRKDLHCWEAMFVRHVSDVDSGFYFRINIKELPDIKVEQHVSDF